MNNHSYHIKYLHPEYKEGNDKLIIRSHETVRHRYFIHPFFGPFGPVEPFILLLRLTRCHQGEQGTSRCLVGTKLKVYIFRIETKLLKDIASLGLLEQDRTL